MKSDSVALHDQHEKMTEHLYRNPEMLPARFVFVLTTRCNLRCDFCFQKKRPLSQAMTVEEWVRVVDQLPEYARVTMTGGEPLLFPGLRNILRRAARKHPCNLITNGLLLTEDWIDTFLSLDHFRVLSISVDDVGNTIRKAPPGQWRRMESVLAYFHQARGKRGGGCLLDIKTTVLDANAHRLYDIHRYCVERLGCDTHAFQFLKGCVHQHADEMVGLETVLPAFEAPVYDRFDVIRGQLEAVRRYAVRHGVRAYLHPKAGSLMAASPLTELEWLNQKTMDPGRFVPCRYPWASLHINDDGQVFPCLSVAVGNVRTESLETIVKGRALKEFRETLRNRGLVGGCNRCGWIRPRPRETGGEPR